MPAAWSSDHPDVLAWWDDLQKRDRSYTRLCNKVEKKQGRQIMLRTGFGDDKVIGLTTKTYREEPPPGWKLGNGKRGSGFFEPRLSPKGAKGPVQGQPLTAAEQRKFCEEAQALIQKLNDKKPSPRTEAHERFGTPVFQFFGLRAISPGFCLMDGRVWIYFGECDFEPPEDSPMLTYFRPEKLSAYHAAREKEEVA